MHPFYAEELYPIVMRRRMAEKLNEPFDDHHTTATEVEHVEMRATVFGQECTLVEYKDRASEDSVLAQLIDCQCMRY